jgi:hypothetical protein
MDGFVGTQRPTEDLRHNESVLGHIGFAAREMSHRRRDRHSEIATTDKSDASEDPDRLVGLDVAKFALPRRVALAQLVLCCRPSTVADFAGAGSTATERTIGMNITESQIPQQVCVAPAAGFGVAITILY